MKQITITFNDDTDQAEIDFLATLLSKMFDAVNMTAVIIVEDTETSEEPKDICCYDEHGDIKIIGSTKLCECGHSMNSHGDNGCIHCQCSNSLTVMERDEEIAKLRKKLDDCEALWLEVCIERNIIADELRVTRAKMEELR